ncbi:MAG: AMP-binding protein [Gammaproteobacteria bacterium]|nr:AMP-binding protein [Gammaproteobacteria bacterium]MBU1655913.1 AMP-binding protein [Gammaproteobacteria bacterium]MBU1961785.1 AMP-binding protein [Gammaproteobacteria bacterium]
MELIERIRRHAAAHPERIALEWRAGRLGYVDLASTVDRLSVELRGRGARTLAIALDNGPAWALIDLAALHAGLCLVPLPPFFSTGQMCHALKLSGAQALITDQAGPLCERLGLPKSHSELRVAGRSLSWIDLPGNPHAVPAGVRKLTFTSGTTGEPKGVMLGWNHMEPVVRSLAGAVEVTPADRHLALTPLSVLLENIAGIYTSLWGGATAILPGCPEVGLAGSSRLDAVAMTLALEQYRATTAIFSPQSLQGLVESIEAGLPRPQALRFGAIGGAPVSPRLLERAAALGLPVYEGYGLSECASVVCLNTPRHNRPGTVGRPLPHVRLTLADDGEVQIAGPGFAGYLGESPPQGAWASGDMGAFDGEGSLRLHGRRRNLFITAFGRNVAPEWVERELTLEPAIAQAAVFGEARPWNLAVIFAAPGASESALEAAIAGANASLPDYAQVAQWITAAEPFTPLNGLLTGTGRVRREAVYRQYQQQIENLYRAEEQAA